MGSPSTLDLEALLQPIPGDLPAGEDLREDSSPARIYSQIKDARNTARDRERKGEFEAVIGSAEASAWRPVLESARDTLAERSKDLEITTWLIEALARTDGFAGLRDGFRLARGLVETFWDGLYPTPDEEGIETRVSPLAGLNGAGSVGTLIAPISRIPITTGSSVAPVAVWSCRKAQELERLSPDDREQRVASGETSMEIVQTAVRETPVEIFVDQLADIDAALVELRALGELLDRHCGAASPPTKAIREALEDAAATIRLIARDVLPVEGGDEVAGGGDAGTDAPSPQAGDAGVVAGASRAVAVGGVPGALSSREDALRALAKVAEFFRQAEPHSPLAFLVERTIRWGRLPLPDLLAELIPDESARDTYAQLTGVKITKPDEG